MFTPLAGPGPVHEVEPDLRPGATTPTLRGGVTTPRVKLAALGDSSGVGIGAGADAGYPDRIAKWLVGLGYRVGLLNLARSGATAGVVRSAQLETAVARTPDVVTLGVGTNDLWRMVPIDSFAPALPENFGPRRGWRGPGAGGRHRSMPRVR